MTQQPFPGGWYCAALPTGEFAVLMPPLKQVVTHQGVFVDPPADEPLFLDISSVGGFKMLGKGHDSNNSWEWKNLIWTAQPTACGNFSVIYDLFGQPHFSDCSIGVNGWRYVEDNGRLITGDWTYGLNQIPNDPDFGKFYGLSEWTKIAPDLVVGQGHDGGGVQVWDAGTMRWLAQGACYDVKARWDRQGTVAIAFYDVAADGLTAWIVQTTVTQLRALPIVAASPAPTPAPLPAPVPLPVPVPVPVPVPLPVPKPVPQPPAKGPTVIHVDGQPGFSGHKVDNGNGTFSIQKLSGVFASLDPQGKWEERPSGGGPWESFLPSSTATIAVAQRDNGATYLVAYVETPDA